MITNSIVMWVILQNDAGWDCFKTPILQEILKTQNRLLEEHSAFWEVIHLFQLVRCVMKQTSVSHSSTESEIIFLDAGLRLDGIPALDSWDLIVLVLGNTTQTHDRTVQPVVDHDVYSTRYSRWVDDKAWSSQEWKADKSMDDRMEQRVVTSWAKTRVPIMFLS